MSVRKPKSPKLQRRQIDPSNTDLRKNSSLKTNNVAKKRKLKNDINPASSKKKRAAEQRINGRNNISADEKTELRKKFSQSHTKLAVDKRKQDKKPLKNPLIRKEVRVRRKNLRERFGKDWDVVLQGTTKTRKIPVRVLAVIFSCIIAVIILANPVQDFLAQQEEKRMLNAQLAETKAELAALQQQVDLWNDASYVQAQARKRLGFVLPGQTLYYVSGDLSAEEKAKKASEAERVIALRRKATPFYINVWKSIEIAGTANLDARNFSNPENAPLMNEPKKEKSEQKTESKNTGK